MNTPIALTGDRPTGPLHLGHYTGSLRTRLEMQNTHRLYVLIADCQAMTDNAKNAGKIRSNVEEVMLDYLAIGLDPSKTVFCLQSKLPALAELSMLYLNYVTVSRLERNPTIKKEIADRGFERAVPAGFLCYPAAQAADITGFGATAVPVGADQLPIIEQTNEIVRHINATAGAKILVEAAGVVSSHPRLPGVDGKGKMSKSSGNAIAIGAEAADIRRAVHAMFTDPSHLRVEDPGQVEGNVVFAFLDAFDHETSEVAILKEKYRRGGLGDGVIKKRLEDILQCLLQPIRERRKDFANNRDFVREILRSGTSEAQGITSITRDRTFEGLGFYGT